MTLTELNKLTEDELALELARGLTPGPWKHEHHLAINAKEFAEYGRGCATNTAYPKWVCFKCSQVIERKSERYEDRYSLPRAGEIEDGCPVPPKLDINDWNEAMEWRDKTPDAAFQMALIEVWRAIQEAKDGCTDGLSRWLSNLIRARDIFIAAYRAKGAGHEV